MPEALPFLKGLIKIVSNFNLKLKATFKVYKRNTFDNEKILFSLKKIMFIVMRLQTKYMFYLKLKRSCTFLIYQNVLNFVLLKETIPYIAVKSFMFLKMTKLTKRGTNLGFSVKVLCFLKKRGM